VQSICRQTTVSPFPSDLTKSQRSGDGDQILHDDPKPPPHPVSLTRPHRPRQLREVPNRERPPACPLPSLLLLLLVVVVVVVLLLLVVLLVLVLVLLRRRLL
jgi:hypothetical protein